LACEPVPLIGQSTSRDGLAQRALRLDLVVDGEGAGFDDHQRMDACRAMPSRSFERGRLRQAGDEVAPRASAATSLAISRRRAPWRGGRGDRHRTDHVPPRLDEVLRERAAHDAETDDTDFPLRIPPPLQIDSGPGRYTLLVPAFKRALPSSWRRIITYRRARRSIATSGGRENRMHIGVAGLGKWPPSRIGSSSRSRVTCGIARRQAEAADSAGAAAVATPRSLPGGLTSSSHPHRCRAMDAVYQGRPPPCRGRAQAVHRDDHGPAQTEVVLATKVRAQGAAFVSARSAARPSGAQGKLIGLMALSPPMPRAPSRSSISCAGGWSIAPVGSGAVMKLTINMR